MNERGQLRRCCLPIASVVVVACHCSAPASPPDIKTMLLTSTVRIVAQKSEDMLGIGSGVVVAPPSSHRETYVLTAAHTLIDAQSVTVEAFSLDQYPFPAHRFTRSSARLVGADRVADLALLSLQGGTRILQPVPICPLDKQSAPPFAAVACGCSLGEPQPLLWTVSVESAVVGLEQGRRSMWWQTSGRDPFQGESGGPLVTPSGLLIGICLRAGANHGEYAHLEEIHRFLSATAGRTASGMELRPAGTRPNSVPPPKIQFYFFPSDLFGLPPSEIFTP